MPDKNKLKLLKSTYNKQNQFVINVNSMGNPDTSTTDGFKDFRPWQDWAYAKLFDGKYTLLNVPTAAGKSVFMKAMSLYCNSIGIKTIIVVPLKDIGGSFTNEKINVPGLGPKEFSVSPPHDLIHTKDKLDYLPLARIVLEFLSAKRGGKVLLCTHRTLVAAYDLMYDEECLDLLDNTHIFVDEAHHVQYEEENDILANGMGRVINHCFKDEYDSSVGISFVTATWLRGDRLRIIPPQHKDKVVSYDLPFDEYIESLVFLKRISFNIHNYYGNVDNVFIPVFKERLGRSIVYLPNINTSYYEGTTKHEQVDMILRSATPHPWEHIVNEDYSYFVSKDRSGKRIVAIDLVDDTANRRKAFNYINQFKECRKHGPNLIIALNTFKEGSNYPLADTCWIIGERKSLTEFIQIIGRLMRDCKGKKQVEINLLLKQANVTDDFVDQANVYLNTVVITMLLEETMAPPLLQERNRNTSEKLSPLTSYFNDSNEYLEVIKLAFDVLSKCADGDKPREIIRDLLEGYGITDEQVIKRVLQTVAYKVGVLDRNVDLLSGLNPAEIDIALLSQCDIIKGVKSFISKGVGIEVFKVYRKALLESVGQPSELQLQRIRDICAWLDSKNTST